MFEVHITVEGFRSGIAVPINVKLAYDTTADIKASNSSAIVLAEKTPSSDRSQALQTRWTSQCGYRVFDRKEIAPNHATRLVRIFGIFAELAPEKLPELSKRLEGRVRKPLSTDPSLIYPSRHLRRHARSIAAGWSIDTNTDTADKIRTISFATEFLGLEFGRDVVLF